MTEAHQHDQVEGWPRLFSLDVAPPEATGSRVAFVHGVFGQGRNWNLIARALPQHLRPTLIDLPNHGRSPWTATFSYLDMADTLAANLRALAPGERWQLVGHSMGGKTAMLTALRNPDLVARLAVVDISPADYGPGRAFEGYVAAMQNLDLTGIRSRTDLEARLAPSVRSHAVRQFLLQNLRRRGEDWTWQPNLVLLARSMDLLSGWPADAVHDVAPYPHPTLWLAGADSDYVRPQWVSDMKSLFPKVRTVKVKDAGHWVHSDQPAAVAQILSTFLTRPSR